MPTIPSHPISIIGAGIGGLSAAIRLAAAGKQVAIYEQNATVGGKMSQIAGDGFRWDTGPSVITMRNVLESLFRDVNRRLEDYLTLLPVDPLARYFYPDGSTLDAVRDKTQMVAHLRALKGVDARDVEGYQKYLQYVARLYEITGPVFIYNAPPTFRSILSVPIFQALQIDPFRSMDAAIQAHVRSPHLRQMLGRFATYVGASPFRAPATLNLIAHVELNEGVYYPRGGIYAIAGALEKLARELGVQIETGTAVEAITVKDGAATGLRLAGGREIPAEAVIANVDVATVYDKLLPSSAANRQYVARLTGAEQSCSGFALLLGVEGTHPDLAHHNVFFSPDYRREFDQIFSAKTPPDDPSIYVAITSKTDSDHAPAGCENWFVLVSVPPARSGDRPYDWQTGADAYRELLLERLATRHGLDVRVKIRAAHVLTPLDLERLTGGRNGALYGLSSNEPLAAFNRPHNRSGEVKRLYFAGGTTHPGGGVPMVMLSGKVAAGMALGDLSKG